MSVAIDSGTVWAEIQRGLDYQNKMGFAKSWPEFADFTEGRQWAAPTPKTKFMPRPVVNFCDSTIENKQSNILSQTLKLMFSPEELQPDTDNEPLIKAGQDYTDAAATTWADIDQDTLNEDFVNDILVLGTGVFHYRFDNSITGGQFTKYIGKMQGETIDPIDIIVGNPHLKASQTQKQPWIAIRSHPDTKELQEKAKKNGKDPTLIVPDDSKNDSKYSSEKINIEQAGTTTLWTKYYKENGQIMWIQVVEGLTVQDPTPLAPDGGKPFTLYPVEIGVFKKRRKCTFGRSMIEDIIPNQKALNWGLGMMLLSVQQTAWPKILAKMGALEGQTITNEPGEIITDHNQVSGFDGVKFMQPPNFSSMPIVLAEKLMDMTRQVTGTTEVTSGEVIGANMAASAIIALQNQAKKPTDGNVQMLLRSLKRVGRIYEEFNKSHGTMPVPIQSKDEQGNDITKTFTGADSKDINFALKIDVTPTSILSESLQMTVVKEMADRQWLDKFAFVKYSPSNVIPAEMKVDFEKEEKQMLELQQKQAQMQQQAGNVIGQFNAKDQAAIKEDPAIIDRAMQQVNGGGQ
ncbi:MAG TPA: hypothetical protein VIK78_14655 [Ruminiclostridium sp.]